MRIGSSFGTSNPSGLCQCGCGATTTRAVYDEPATGVKSGEYHRFIRNHHHNLMRRFIPKWGQYAQKNRESYSRWLVSKMANGRFTVHTSIQELRLWCAHANAIAAEQRAFIRWRGAIMAQQNRIYRKLMTAFIREKRRAQWAILTAIEDTKQKRKKSRREAKRRQQSHTKNTVEVFQRLAVISTLTP